MRKPTKPVPEQLLTIDDVAALCRVSSKTVRRWIKTRELAAAKLGAQWRIRPRDVDLFIHERMER
jgi:excisionase family DNA binding protein